ncbi:MAG: nucleoside triphosphate pyrophosphohydrolase [Bacteroidales bacterium]|jgi:XTP/dITP diphosphohydrolase
MSQKYKRELELFQELLEIMDKLRSGCPWDKKQTIESLRYLTIEETYELSDAIINENYKDIQKELGDLIMHIVFYAKIGEEQKGDQHFTLVDVLENINTKLINRHPHIFGDVKVNSAEDVKQNWEQIKLKEKDRKSVLSGVPVSMPSLIKAYRIQDKAHGIGFDWDNIDQVWDKVEEEVDELKTEIKNGDKEKIELEFGDLLFALINYSRFLDINPDDALEKSNKKFITRFNYIEQKIKESKKHFNDYSLAELEEFWKEAKKNE